MKSRDPHSEIILKHLDIVNNAMNSMVESIVEFMSNPNDSQLNTKHHAVIRARISQFQSEVSHLKRHMIEVHPLKENDLNNGFAPVSQAITAIFPDCSSLMMLSGIISRQGTIFDSLSSIRTNVMIQVANLLEYREQQLSQKNPSEQNKFIHTTASEPKSWPTP